jgi:hypothetical protein
MKPLPHEASFDAYYRMRTGFSVAMSMIYRLTAEKVASFSWADESASNTLSVAL